jgi:hypothetical protein
VQLRKPGRFDPTDPANTHVVPVTLAAVVFDPIDLGAGLRVTRSERDAARDLVSPAPTTLPIEATAAYATAVVFPAAGLGPGLSATDVERLLAREGVVSLFMNAS